MPIHKFPRSIISRIARSYMNSPDSQHFHMLSLQVMSNTSRPASLKATSTRKIRGSTGLFCMICSLDIAFRLICLQGFEQKHVKVSG